MPEFCAGRDAPRTEGQSSQTVGKDGTDSADPQQRATPEANGGALGPRPFWKDGLSSRGGFVSRCWGMEPFLQVYRPL